MKTDLKSDFSRVAEAMRFLEAEAARQPSLAEVAAHLGLSEDHVHRLFHRFAGVTPKTFLQLVTHGRARRLLDGDGDGASLLDASHALGLSGPSRLHDLFVQLEAMTPGAYKRAGEGVVVRHGRFATPFGEVLLAATERGLCRLSLLDEDALARAESEAVDELAGRWPRARLVADRPSLAAMADAVAARMRGGAAPLSLLVRGTPFQTQVWQALLAIPDGQVTTYRAIAQAIGRPLATRAVGNAVGENPIAVLIPCHRVIRESGLLGGYRWGRSRKLALLAAERARGVLSASGHARPP